MKMKVFFLILILTFSVIAVHAQCSICSRTAQQMGDEPAKSLNAGILYLAAAPLLIAGYIGYRWYRSNGNS
jgi:hypothetical protein